MFEKNIRLKYSKLEEKYKKLKIKYDKLIEKTRKTKKIIKRDYQPVTVTILLSLVGILGLFTYRSWLIIELGIIGFIVDIITETYGTNKGMWSYRKSKIFMIGKVPIEIPLLVFSLGMCGVTLIMFLLNTY